MGLKNRALQVLVSDKGQDSFPIPFSTLRFDALFNPLFELGQPLFSPSREGSVCLSCREA